MRFAQTVLPSCSSATSPAPLTLMLTATLPLPLHVVASRLGDDPKVVLATYAHLLPHSDEMAAAAVAAQLVDNRLTASPHSQS
jgi:hypothetical protein